MSQFGTHIASGAGSAGSGGVENTGVSGGGGVGDVSGALDLDAVVDQVHELSSLPHVAAKVIEAASDESCGAADMRQIVEGDPALSARVIKCVNSAAYGLRTKISSLQRAISYLGFKQVRNLAVTASVAGIFKSDDPGIGRYNRGLLWRHMVVVAVVSRMIAKRCHLQDFEEVFLAGLLHDIGIILEDQYCHTHFKAMMQSLSEGHSLCQNEVSTIGFDHTRLGARIATDWKFADAVTDSIRFHHNIDQYRGAHKKTVACVDVANLLCGASGRSSIGVNLVKPNATSLTVLGLGRTDIKVLAKDMENEISEQQELFRLMKS